MRNDPRFIVFLIALVGITWLSFPRRSVKKDPASAALGQESTQDKKSESAAKTRALIQNEALAGIAFDEPLRNEELLTETEPVLPAVALAPSGDEIDSARVNSVEKWTEAMASVPRGPALTLRDCYMLALKRSEQIAIEAEYIREAEAHFLQSLGALLPQVSFSWSQTNKDSEKVFSSYGNNSSHEGSFVFKQTLFAGFKEFAGMAGSRLEKSQFAEQKKRAGHLLFVDVVDAFYLLLEQQEDLKALETIRVALFDRINELKKREDIGRTRHSEVVNTEAQLYNIEAEIELSRSEEMMARELLEFLIGQPAGPVVDPEDTPDTLQDEANYLAASDSRPDVQAAEYAWAVDQKEIRIAQSGLFPEVSVEGEYFTHRDTAPTDTTWSTLLSVDVPIFEGTTTYGTIKEKRSLARVTELQFLRTKRLADRDIHDSYVRALAAIIRTQALDKALKAAELNYSLQKEDYQYSLVSNLDVLAAIQNLGNTRRNYLQTFYEKQRRFWELQAAVGKIELEQSP